MSNELIYAAAVVTKERLGVEVNRKKHEGKPRWKRRLENQVKRSRKGLSRIEELTKGTKIKAKFENDLQRTYWTMTKGLNAVNEEINQRMAAKAAKITRYQVRIGHL